jgi:hypothetical protein
VDERKEEKNSIITISMKYDRHQKVKKECDTFSCRMGRKESHISVFRSVLPTDEGVDFLKPCSNCDIDLAARDGTVIVNFLIVFGRNQRGLRKGRVSVSNRKRWRLGSVPGSIV